MTSIDIKLKALFNILSGFQFLHPWEHTLISLHNATELLHFKVPFTIRKGNAALCYSHNRVTSQPWSSSPATIRKQQHQKLIPVHSAWSSKSRAPPALSTQMNVAHPPRVRTSPTKGKTQFQNLSGVRHRYHITPDPPSKKPQPSSCIQANAGTEQPQSTTTESCNLAEPRNHCCQHQESWDWALQGCLCRKMLT